MTYCGADDVIILEGEALKTYDTLYYSYHYLMKDTDQSI